MYIKSERMKLANLPVDFWRTRNATLEESCVLTFLYCLNDSLGLFFPF